jgi:hypothetical protein
VPKHVNTHIIANTQINVHSSSIGHNIWIMICFTSFKYFEMLWNKKTKLVMILHILFRELILFWRPKTTLALLFIAILNMDFCTYKVICTQCLNNHFFNKSHFFRVQNKTLTTFICMLNDSSHSSNN